MKPVKNLKYIVFDIGEVWEGQMITSLVDCTDAGSCKRSYKNFDISCGGYRRLFGDRLNGQCLFFTTKDNLLAGSLDGEAIT